MKHFIIQKILLLPILWIIGCMGLYAQRISVLSFVETLNDRDAVHFKKEDQNGNACSLIKIVTTQKGFKFDIGSLPVIATEEKEAEIWLYVPAGTARIKVLHPQLGQLMTEDGYYWFNQKTKAATTYRLVLTTGEVETVVREAVTQQFLTVYLDPKEASLEINGDVWIPDAEGVVSKYLEFGEYEYRAFAPMYYPSVGRVTINDPDKPHELHISLRPNHGFLEVKAATTEMNGALVYVDDERVGEVPLTGHRLKNGTHRVRIVKPLYKPFEQTVTVADSTVAALSPSLIPNFVEATVTAPNKAEIWINGVKKASDRWNGPLEPGTYRFEARLAGHRPSVQNETIRIEDGKRTIALQAPEPVYGAVSVTSSPVGATIYIDGKEVGTTPFVVRNVLIGERKIELKKPYHSTFVQTVTVEEGKTGSVSGTLSNVAHVRISASGCDGEAALYMDGEEIGVSAVEKEIACGNHTFSARCTDSGKREWYGERTVNVGNDGSDIVVPMKKLPLNYQKPTHLYAEVGYQLLDYSGIGVALGGYFKNLNLELGYTMGGQESDIYWYSEDGNTRVLTTYAANRLHLKLGYGFTVGNSIQITPQLGGGLLLLKNGNSDIDNALNTAWGKTYAVQWIGAVRMTYAILPWCQLVVTPEYAGALKKGPLFNVLGNTSSNIKAWGTGLSIKAGFSFYF